MSDENAGACLDPDGICQLDICVADAARSLAFYAAAFGWRDSPCEIQNYHVLAVPDHCRFGIALIPDPNVRFRLSACCLTFRVGSPAVAEAMAAAAAEQGGRSLGTRDFAGYGRVWQVCDPDGQRYGLFAGNGPG